MLKLRQFQVAKEILEHQNEIQVAQDKKLERKRYMMVVYARMVLFMQKYLAGLRGAALRATGSAGDGYLEQARRLAPSVWDDGQLTAAELR